MEVSFEEQQACKDKCEAYTHAAHELFRKWHGRLLDEAVDIDGPDWMSECQHELNVFIHEVRTWHTSVFTKMPAHACDIGWIEERIGHLNGIISCRLHDEIFFHFYKEKKK